MDNMDFDFIPVPLVSTEAPDFTATAVVDQEFKEVTLSQYRGKYVVLFFYPLDFTFVCPSEIIAFDRAVSRFEEKNAQRPTLITMMLNTSSGLLLPLLFAST